MINNTQFYKEGSGDASILPSNPVIPLLRQQVAQEQQKKEAQAQASAQQLAKLNFDKVKSSDVPDFMTGYNDIKNDYGQLQAEQDPVKRVALQNQIDQKKVLFQQHVANSQALLAHEQELAKVPLNPNAHVKDDYADQVAKLSGLKSSDPEYGKAATYFGTPFKDKDYDMNAATQGLLKTSLDPIGTTYTTTTLPGGIKQILKNDGNNLNKDKFLDGTLKQMSGNDSFRRNIMKQYLGLQSEDAAAKYADEQYELHKDDYGPNKTSAGIQWQQKSAPLSQEFIYKRDHGLLGQPKVVDEAIPAYNVAGNVSIPLKNGSTQIGVSTSPVEIDAGDIKGAVVPDKVYDTKTGFLTNNTDARNIKDAKIRLLPVDTYGGSLLSDEEVQQAKQGKLIRNGKNIPYSAIKYQYMVYGTEATKVPVMTTNKDDSKSQAKDINKNDKFETIQKPVAFSAKNLNDDKFSKKVNYDKIEANLSQEVRDKIDRGAPPAQQSTIATAQSGMVSMQLPDGTTGQIPATKVGDFLKKYPKAKKL